jgi:hypothetical protein
MAGTLQRDDGPGRFSDVSRSNSESQGSERRNRFASGITSPIDAALLSSTANVRRTTTWCLRMGLNRTAVTVSSRIDYASFGRGEVKASQLVLDQQRGGLFVTQSHHWVDAHRSSGGKVTRQNGNANQYRRNACERCGVARANSIEQVGEAQQKTREN